MRRREQRTATCGRAEAMVRLGQARKFYEVAGIAAADAACCAALGRRSRAQDHKAAVELVRQVEPGGAEAAKNLDRLLDLKDSAHYGSFPSPAPISRPPSVQQAR